MRKSRLFVVMLAVCGLVVALTACSSQSTENMPQSPKGTTGTGEYPRPMKTNYRSVSGISETADKVFMEVKTESGSKAVSEVVSFKKSDKDGGVTSSRDVQVYAPGAAHSLSGIAALSDELVAVEDAQVPRGSAGRQETNPNIVLCDLATKRDVALTQYSQGESPVQAGSLIGSGHTLYWMDWDRQSSVGSIVVCDTDTKQVSTLVSFSAAIPVEGPVLAGKDLFWVEHTGDPEHGSSTLMKYDLAAHRATAVKSFPTRGAVLSGSGSDQVFLSDPTSEGIVENGVQCYTVSKNAWTTIDDFDGYALSSIRVVGGEYLCSARKAGPDKTSAVGPSSILIYDPQMHETETRVVTDERKGDDILVSDYFLYSNTGDPGNSSRWVYAYGAPCTSKGTTKSGPYKIPVAY